MLGFGAVGQHALGRSDASSSLRMAADAGAFVLTGVAARAFVTLASGSGSFALTGSASVLTQAIGSSAGSFALTGGSAVVQIANTAGTVSFALTGYDASLSSSEVVIIRRSVSNGGICLGHDALGMLGLGEIPDAEFEDTAEIARRPLYSRGVSYWKGTA